MTDVSDRQPRKTKRLGNAEKRALEQNNIGTLHGDIRTVAHSTANVGRGQGGCVVHAIADHYNTLAAVLQVFYIKSFSSDLCIDINNLFVFDDKSSILVADEYILYLNEKGESISKKSIFHNDNFGVFDYYFWCTGEKNSGESCILSINLKDRISTVKKTPTQDMQGFENGIFWCFGENDDQESELYIFNLFDINC